MVLSDPNNKKKGYQLVAVDFRTLKVDVWQAELRFCNVYSCLPEQPILLVFGYRQLWVEVNGKFEHLAEINEASIAFSIVKCDEKHIIAFAKTYKYSESIMLRFPVKQLSSYEVVARPDWCSGWNILESDKESEDIIRFVLECETEKATYYAEVAKKEFEPEMLKDIRQYSVKIGYVSYFQRVEYCESRDNAIMGIHQMYKDKAVYCYLYNQYREVIEEKYPHTNKVLEFGESRVEEKLGWKKSVQFNNKKEYGSKGIRMRCGKMFFEGRGFFDPYTMNKVSFE